MYRLIYLESFRDVLVTFIKKLHVQEKYQKTSFFYPLTLIDLEIKPSVIVES